MLDFAITVWFALTALSVLYVAWDAFGRNPELTVMKWGWVLVTLYAGPVAAAVYVLSCQEPAPGGHERFVVPLWKQALGSTIHCLAGDATGIILAAAITVTLGMPMWVDVVVEYVAGFGFGLLVFQALFMRDMLGGSYAEALRRSFLPEWLSMNAVMAGMIPVMVALMASDMRAMEPSSLRFWGVMSLATLVGAVVAYPVNVWLVAVSLKHGMGTVRALGGGGHTLAAEAQRDPAVARAPAPSPALIHTGMVGMGSAGPHATHAVTPGPGDPMAGYDGMDMESSATPSQLAAVTLLTLLLLGAGVVLADLSGGFASDAAMEHGPGMSMPMPAR